MKKLFVSFFRSFVYGGHLVAIQPPMMMLSVMLLRGLTVDIAVIVITYLVTLLIYSYNYIREAGIDQADNPERALHVKSKLSKIKKMFYGGGIVLVVLLVAFANLDVVILITAILLFGILYTEVFKKVRIAGFKNLYASLTWVSIILVVPLQYGQAFDLFYLSVMALYFLAVCSNTIFSDIKDIAGDRENKVLTLPVVFGLKGTYWIVLSMKVITFVLFLIIISYQVMEASFIFYALVILYSTSYTVYSAMRLGDKTKFLGYMVADLEFIVTLVILFIGKVLFLLLGIGL